MTSQIRIIAIFIAAIFLNACATYHPQYKDSNREKDLLQKDIAYSFYLIGDAGNSPLGTSSKALEAFKNALSKATEHSTAIFLGDNVYPKGLPKKNHQSRAFAEHQLNIQTAAVKNFKGKTIFIPGNHDWYSGIKGLKRQEDFIEDKLGKNTFLPENGCPIEKVDISDDVVLIIIDSEWYLADWDNYPTINDDCDIKTRTKFFDELEGEIKKAQGKTTLIAVHHPMFTNGSHGGQYSFSSHLKPFPVLGTLKNLVRKTGGVTTVDVQNKLYNTFRKRVITLSQENDKVIFVSGHDHNLQYIFQDNLPQIISGSGSKISATRNVGKGQFSYATPGYAILDVYTDGSSKVRFFSAEDGNVVFQTDVLSKDKGGEATNYPASFPKEKTASIYKKEEITKGGVYRTIWGERFRNYYGTEVKAPIVDLDTLFGGLTPIRKGGGHQSKSLRLKDKQGREYVMRALRKNAIQYLQAVAFKDQYIEGEFEDTYTEGLLQDVFTGSHPYAPFVVGTLADAVGVYHTNPVLYYVPKQKAIGIFNDEFGDELYMIEERTDDGHGDKASFGFSNTMISTDDLLKKINKDEDFVLDEAAYIRARLFDMLIGDWDRHEDQWRWAAFKESGKTMYRPVPRDRDQVFSKMADGVLLGFATSVIPGLRLMKSYDEDLKNPKWFNLEPYPLDMALINQSDRKVWNAQVKQIVDNLTDEVIDKTFANFPKEVQDETIQDIKLKLRGRRSNLQKISDAYYNHINKFGIVKGTSKDDWFEIERLPNGNTKVTAYRIKKGEKADVFHQRTYNCNDTNEIWVYGLDDDDVFNVSGEADMLIKIRLIGGQNNDTYDILNGKKVKIYDYKSKENTFKTTNGNVKLTDDYETNVYDYKKLKNNTNQLIPTIGANPDDGFKIGLSNTFTKYGFERNPFTSQHTLSGAYYFATEGFDLHYKGEFANVVGNMNLGLKAHFTSPNFAMNFFGFGNETPNYEADENDGLDVGLDYNRVKISLFKVAPSLIWRGRFGASFEVGVSYEHNEVEETEGRFINLVLNDIIEVSNGFYGIQTKYQYSNSDNEAFPTLGMLVAFEAGYKNNVDTSKGFGYIIPEIAFDYKLLPSGQLVLASKLKAQINLGDDFEFYQAANIGANNGLRGYRNERFTGKTAFVQSTDLRLNLRKVKTGLLPLNIGLYGGADYGRVWVKDDDSDRWNTSVGGGIFVNAANMVTGNFSAFHSHDGLLLAFKLGFGF
ncbi:Calcineurin-like phosphoesterase [Mariniflexile rhizosphaerae]|uniref:metallophosphoesterase n=1 Tax=unclassified Mariniflexile TaxID=2643887 RepID=UPI000CB59187|nr:metallophosphoesterase [Mariniflexile sp. TRM1-10]AXP80008.1 Calcineurin-like phosphoesterase [Mariniflexile sp. TRM1-10]PLB20986.1 MAG: Outer membrane protein [Flavobacteriaceae bacterium FS1-H7996/R]